MADPQHLKLLEQGVEAWNRWRVENAEIKPNLSGADLRKHDLSTANLAYVNLEQANLEEVCLRGASLEQANLLKAELQAADLEKANLKYADLAEAFIGDAYLRNANLKGANLGSANLCLADLAGANLYKASLEECCLIATDLSNTNLKKAYLNGANLRSANLKGADLSYADLSHAILVDVDLEDANITNCSVYGISAWNLKLHQTKQINLIITRNNEPTITVDNIEVAQFIYLLLNNEKIRDVIDTITSKVVLILGRFTKERKQVLDAIRNALRRHDYTPILFDFEKPKSKNLTGTISTLAHMARFVIADITEAKSIPQELQRIVPDNPSLPVQPIILATEYEYSMFESLIDYPWVLTPYPYDNLENLLKSLEKKVIVPAEKRVKKMERARKAVEKEIESRRKAVEKKIPK
jgi:uncharacterized protein YjbI with pentapeptide repeats